MNRVLYVVMLSLAAAGCVACAGSRYVAKEFTPLIPEIAKFETMSRMHLIEKGNRSEYNDSISWIARGELDKILYEHSPNLPLATEEIAFSSPFQGEFVGEEIDIMLASIMENRANIRHLPVPPIIKSILAAEGQRFGLIVVHDGFARVKGNYGGQVAKAVGVGLLTGILTMGAYTYMETPMKANSTLHAIIVDTERDGIVFYNSTTREADPTDPEVLMRQTDKVFKKIFR